MASRPRDLADRMAGRRKRDDGFLRETFTLPRDKARTKARDFLTRYPKAAYMSSVETWRELPGGDIEFTAKGEVLRVCSLVWRQGEVIGARFVTAKELRQGFVPGGEADTRSEESASG